MSQVCMASAPCQLEFGLIMNKTKKPSGKRPRSSKKASGKAKKNTQPRVPTPKIFSGLPDAELTAQQQKELRGLVKLAEDDPKPIENRIETICPEGSILSVIAGIFRRTTDFPLELPIFMVIAYIAAFLVSKSAMIRVCGKLVDPFLWIILLAQSGNGKTFTEQFISRHISVPMFPQINSAAKFVEELSRNNHSLWLQDEFAQLLKRIQSKDYMSDLREYLLRTYDKSEIVRSNMKGTTFVPDPVLTLLGMTVSDTFADNISSEMMLDGFMQRFQIVYGDPDPTRPMSDFPIYKTNAPCWSKMFARSWAKIAAVPIHPVYKLGSGALDEYEQRFRDLFGHLGEVPQSFFRRITWNAHKLALVYHVILCKRSAIIDRHDMRWAMNVTALHLMDLRRLIDSYGVSELAELIKRAEGVRDRFEERHGRKITPREFSMGLKGIKHVGMMSFIMNMLGIAK